MYYNNYIRQKARKMERQKDRQLEKPSQKARNTERRKGRKVEKRRQKDSKTERQ